MLIVQKICMAWFRPLGIKAKRNTPSLLLQTVPPLKFGGRGRGKRAGGGPFLCDLHPAFYQEVMESFVSLISWCEQTQVEVCPGERPLFS